MVDVRPFRGLLPRDPGGDDGRCAAPPYDVLEPAERDAYAARSAANVVHLTLPRAEGGADRYAAAARRLARMREDGRLVADVGAAWHLQDCAFTPPGATAPCTRRGLLALVRLEPLGRGVRGHEEVMDKPLQDRRALLDATLTQLEPIFLLFRDPQGEVDRALEAARRAPPRAVADVDGVRHEFRRAAAEDAPLASLLHERPLYVADGHHRYTVAERFARERPDLPAAAWRLALLVRAEDPGLLVLPTHRFLPALDGDAARELRRRIAADFVVAPVAPEALLGALAREERADAFGAWWRDDGAAAILRPRAAVADALRAIDEPLKSLDVTVLHRHLLAGELGGGPARCRYVRGVDDPIGMASAERVPLAFFLRAPPIATVLAVADQGRTMPPKSTYFQPKAASGQVLHPLDGTLETLG